MQLKSWRHELTLAHTWTIARRLHTGGADVSKVVIVELTDPDGHVGRGEATPTLRYGETTDSALAFLERVNTRFLSLDDLPASIRYLESLAPGERAARGALDVALLDIASQRAGKSLYDYLGLGFTENRHTTSFSIGIDTPEVIRQKVAAAESYPILKLKVGSPGDRENLAALREIAPTKTVRVDGNEAWKTKEQALREIEHLATDPHIEFVEQPMPDSTPLEDLRWLKKRSPLPLMADESFHTAADVEKCLEGFHAVNVKLVKTAGITPAFTALKAARKAGLKTMLGCMIETSILITAAAHLAELTDYLDIDGNLLVTNDPYTGVTAENGIISFLRAPGTTGLRVAPRG
ncbi:MAG TPA: dipeptide epimerase [Roseimicrobium sp.]|nr:dipeptide epimerase [Roseimicrobium sp.]